jgi:uncharacterized protein
VTLSPLDRELTWRPSEGVGLEHCHVMRTERESRIRSAVVTANHGFFYSIDLDELGRVRAVHVERTDGRTLDLVADGSGIWTDGGGAPHPNLNSCIDVDFSATPFTNSLPIWRSNLIVGQPQRFVMAWIDADDLSVFSDAQIYTRLDDGHFRYQSADGGFERVIEIDTEGLVVDYPGLFARVG